MAEDSRHFIATSWRDVLKKTGIDYSHITNVREGGNDLLFDYFGTTLTIKNGGRAYRSHLLVKIYRYVMGMPLVEVSKIAENLKLDQLIDVSAYLEELHGPDRLTALHDIVSMHGIPSKHEIPSELREKIDDARSVNVNELLEEKQAEDLLKNPEDVYTELFEKAKKLG